MNKQGEHKLIKVCIPDLTVYADSVIVFGMGDEDKCVDRVNYAYELTEKGKAYYKKAGFDKFLPNYNKDENDRSKNNVNIKLPPVSTGLPDVRLKEENSKPFEIDDNN